MSSNKEPCSVYLNGKRIGSVKDGALFTAEIRKHRRGGVISGEINVTHFEKMNEVRINADRGRVRAPYIIVENGESKFTPELLEKVRRKEMDFNYLLRRGIIEYLDAEEEENVVIALDEDSITKATTHLVVDPGAILGLTVNTSVFSEFNNVGRLPMSTNFVKQSQVLYATNFNNRYDARGFLLYYPQIPVVNSVTYRNTGLEKHPSGQNLVVALSTYYGYNMKDAIILSKAAVDRGMGRSAFYRTYAEEENRYPGGQQDHFKIPAATIDGYLGEHAYSKLGEDGIIEVGMDVKEGDVLIGKLSPPRFLEEQTSFGMGEERNRDNSVALRGGEEGIVDNVMLSETKEATKIAKVRIRSVKIPENGDKFASRHGQKGVVGLIVEQEDMPFTKDGLIPDLILNPHSLPGRMTMGHMLETLAGKTASLKGTRMDGTAFSNNGRNLIDEYGEALGEHGFDKFGDEELYDGRTGKKFNAKIFTGVVYFNRLIHMVSLRIQARSRGPVQILTHQPTEGKNRRGGIRFGEMERDALVGHGASLLIKERMLDQSDKMELWVCKTCGDIGYYDYIKNVPMCAMCGSGSNMEKVEMSYAFKLLLYEIKSMHILARINLKSG